MTGTCVSVGASRFSQAFPLSLKTLFDKQDIVALGITDISCLFKGGHFEMPKLKHNN